ncbi:MAG TPA: hypothetical protein VFH59_03125 [Frateuria sp.]|uniref:hypothetical protein n=1 Tax=Frateuria sp. TaxID=2211372 RepID=UPI002D80AD8E|nr:hypothetical protein [Frateuria sp.]HET6804419.1 hypothetical protein [Frateuria sp.]
MRLSRPEKWVIAIAGVVACLAGALAGYGTLTRALEDQFHGGVLEEDKVAVMWLNARETAAAFAVVASVLWVALGLLPVGVYRLLARARR